MNLRLRTLLASSIATVALVTGLSIGLSYLVLRQIGLIETHTMSRRLDQTIKALFDDLGSSIDTSPPVDRRKLPEQTNLPGDRSAIKSTCGLHK
jgi:hypothetical protein